MKKIRIILSFILVFLCFGSLTACTKTTALEGTYIRIDLATTTTMTGKYDVVYEFASDGTASSYHIDKNGNQTGNKTEEHWRLLDDNLFEISGTNYTAVYVSGNKLYMTANYSGNKNIEKFAQELKKEKTEYKNYSDTYTKVTGSIKDFVAANPL